MADHVQGHRDREGRGVEGIFDTIVESIGEEESVTTLLETSFQVEISDTHNTAERRVAVRQHMLSTLLAGLACGARIHGTQRVVPFTPAFRLSKRMYSRSSYSDQMRARVVRRVMRRCNRMWEREVLSGAPHFVGVERATVHYLLSAPLVYMGMKKRDDGHASDSSVSSSSGPSSSSTSVVHL
ncbi:hypothetical protein KIPB_003841 [Kipferlia bialata]|uniref:Uncharacterized protein n=1 Tax=Kipferlia bialata TaxID=797122 RepID=A0A391P1L8_9EUKA|nr:hypothetical protein KIPB_003841 [Kipferlia bialata]|eukprot:g3841.t1